MHLICEPPILYFGTPVALVSSYNANGTENLAPISSIFWLGWRCIIGLGSSNKTTENLHREKKCVINLPSVEQVAAVDRLALKTGSNPVPLSKQKRGYYFEPDKFGISGFTREQGSPNYPAHVKECPVQMEATVAAAHTLAQDDPTLSGRITTFELKIDRVYLDENILANGQSDKVDPDKWKPLIMSFQQFYGLGQQIHRSALAQIPEQLYRMKINNSYR